MSAQAASPATVVRRPRSAAERAARVRFRRALALMLMTLVLPGSAQLVAGNRRLGRWALRTTAVMAVGTFLVVLISYFWHGLFFFLGTTPWVLTWLRVGLIVLAIAWAGLFVDAWRLGQPLTLTLSQRRWAILANGALAMTVASTLLYGSHEVGVTRSVLVSMFGGGASSAAVDGRYNVLLLGADSGVSRWGLRTDSMTVASIDAYTGKTVLIGLPRNMENFPFPEGSVMAKQFPHGYDCEGCELNSLTTYADDHKALFTGYDQPGVEATKEGIEGITGLKINYWAMINLQGFRDLADAVGGVTINVRQPIAIGPTGNVTGYIQPGVKKLSGDTLLWYARSRATSDDYSRMARQKCVMNAMLQQLSPADVVKHFDSIASAGRAMFKTSIPTSEVGTFVELALKARKQKVATVSLVPPAINTGNPDIDKARRMVSDAIDKAEGEGGGGGDKTGGGKHKQKKHSSSSQMTEGSYGSLSTGYTANQTNDLAAAC
ncbi:LCP family protein [Nocardioides cheoyonin]|uniref:LCP family protein n=1 Tax=Nocardioides cheoyonin TaxID=3156615 RepID=UPI0032B57329